MAAEYVIAGRLPLPGGPLRLRTWSFTFTLENDDEDEDLDAELFEDGDCAIDEVKRGEKNVWTWVEELVGFKPKSVITVRKAGWEFSQAAAEVLAAALDGVYFCDAEATPADVTQPFESAAPARSVAELQARIEAAAKQAGKYFRAWQDAAERAQAAEDLRNPEGAVLRKRENDWSDL